MKVLPRAWDALWGLPEADLCSKSLSLENHSTSMTPRTSSQVIIACPQSFKPQSDNYKTHLLAGSLSAITCHQSHSRRVARLTSEHGPKCSQQFPSQPPVHLSLLAPPACS